MELNQVLQRLDRMEEVLKTLLERETRKDFYSTDEVARILGKDPFTVREWARLGRINAEKRRSGRGRYCSWAISHEELVRIQRDGLLPASG